MRKYVYILRDLYWKKYLYCFFTLLIKINIYTCSLTKKKKNSKEFSLKFNSNVIRLYKEVFSMDSHLELTGTKTASKQ